MMNVIAVKQLVVDNIAAKFTFLKLNTENCRQKGLFFD